MGKMTVPSKAELKEEIAKLKAENAKLQFELEKERRARWAAKLPEARNEFARRSEELFPNNMVRLVMLDHVDSEGYWFALELSQDGGWHSGWQIYCVKHEELEGKA